ncbi:MAG: hypothetical protein WA919_14935 [Coleofasciculaceae cyanobacterium]
MKLNSTVALTLLLLAMMLSAGFVSAMWGFTIGHEALKGVTQPDVRPTKKLAGSQSASVGKEGLSLLEEENILINVDAYIRGKGKNSSTEQEQSNRNSQTETSQQSSSEQVFSRQATFTSASNNLKLPVKTQDQGVTLEVRSASQQGGSLSLDVSLKNDGPADVRFLYSFLNVTDDRGRALSAITEGLPGELPANGQEFSGTVSIPAALLDESEKLSLTLTDYPDQKLQLKTSEIPVVR